VQISSSAAMPRALSTRQMMKLPAPRAARTASTWARDSVFDSTTPRTPACASAARSAANHGVVASFTRTSKRSRAAAGCAPIHAAALSRAAAFAAGMTASSKSTMTASAPAAAALSKRSGRSPGTNR
jgi:hypothetical protein